MGTHVAVGVGHARSAAGEVIVEIAETMPAVLAVVGMRFDHRRLAGWEGVQVGEAVACGPFGAGGEIEDFN